MNILTIAALLVGISEPCSGKKGIDRYSYVESVRRAGDMPVLLCRTDSQEAIDAAVSRLDLLVMTGGEDVEPALYGESPSPKLGRVNAVRDRFETAVLAAAVRHEVPVFGTCRGVQMMNVFFGGTLYQDLPSEFAFKTPERHTSGAWDTDKGEYLHGLEIVAGSRLASICGTGPLEVNSSHHQAVKGLAPGFRVSAFSPGGVVEAIECDWYPAAGVQFHPEELVVCRGDAVWTAFYSRLRDFAGRRPSIPAARRPIGVFDSGIGGLSVLEAMLALDSFDNATGEERPDGRPDFEDESFVYFGDQANMPYGRYAAEGRADFLRELAVRGAQFVLGGRGHDPSKAVVIACNTATAYGLDRVKAMARPGDAPVIGVADDVRFVDPAVQTAKSCYMELRRRGLLAPPGARRGTTRRVTAFLSEGRGGPLPDGVKYGRGIRSFDIGTVTVPMTPGGITAASPAAIRATAPLAAKELGL